VLARHIQEYSTNPSIKKLADVPSPAGPTPRELEAQRRGEAKVIPLKTVGRNTKQHEHKEESNESFRNRPQTRGEYDK
jgi:hypothetical protein